MRAVLDHYPDFNKVSLIKEHGRNSPILQDKKPDMCLRTELIQPTPTTARNSLGQHWNHFLRGRKLAPF